MFADMFYDNEARLAKIAADAKSLNADMIKLYTVLQPRVLCTHGGDAHAACHKKECPSSWLSQYGHLSLGLDIAELYISAAKVLSARCCPDAGMHARTVHHCRPGDVSWHPRYRVLG